MILNLSVVSVNDDRSCRIEITLLYNGLNWWILLLQLLMNLHGVLIRLNASIDFQLLLEVFLRSVEPHFQAGRPELRLIDSLQEVSVDNFALIDVVQRPSY